MGFLFVAIVVLFLLVYLRPRKIYSAPPHKEERDRIEAHRNKRTLIIKDGTPATDETQVQYFATGKGFVNGDKI